jgi:multimeric flavodoxin WrbA
MKILIISGTPKHDGVTHDFVVAAQAVVAEMGHQAEVINPHHAGIQCCAMCNDGWGICFKQHRCVFDDGFNEMREKVRDSQGFIYITPVYWGEASEGMMRFLNKLRRCEATKQWNEGAGDSFAKGKPSLLVANAGGGGGGVLTCLQQMERAIAQMGGDPQPRPQLGIVDFIGVNPWNIEYKMEAMKCAIRAMITNKLSGRER